MTAASSLSADPARQLTIVVGITGGIAAYKAVGLVREFIKRGHDVHIIATDAALRFVGLPTLEAISRNAVSTSVFDDVSEVRHVALGRRADLVVIAPATADSIARMAHGLASDLLGTTLLATAAPVVIAPAMHPQMWEHAATRANVALLRERGVHVVGPVVGALTGDDAGIGRMSEPVDIADAALAVAASAAPVSGSAGTTRQTADSGDLEGVHVVVSAGGTREPLDPVRFIGNRSSGRQGAAIASEASARGASVTLVAANVAPSVLSAVPPRVTVIPVGSAAELSSAMHGVSGAADVIVMTAAVADFRPAEVRETKIKKDDRSDHLVLDLIRNPDILAGLVAERRPGQLIVGFAAETEPDRDARLDLGRAKIQRKPADLLIINHVGWSQGFEREENAIDVLVPDGTVIRSASGTKAEIAHVILDLIATGLA